MEEHCNFRGKKAVAQLAVVDSAGLMLTLVESMGVQAHALLPSLREAAPVLAKSKGAACFAWADGATQSDAARLAVGVKKRVLVYSAANGDAASLVESGSKPVDAVRLSNKYGPLKTGISGKASGGSESHPHARPVRALVDTLLWPALKS